MLERNLMFAMALLIIGTAIAVIIKPIATTTSTSSRENPSGALPAEIRTIVVTPSLGILKWGHDGATGICTARLYGTAKLEGSIVKRKGLYCRSENRSTVDHFKYFHDVCVVWTPPIPGISPLAGSCRQLDDRLSGVLFSGAREPNRFVSIFDGAVEDDPGSHYADRFFDLFRHVPERPIPLELRRGVRIYHLRGLLYVL
jgi:hypothetical protein